MFFSLRYALLMTVLCMLLAAFGVGLNAALAHMSHLTEQALRSLHFALNIQQYHLLVIIGLGMLSYITHEPGLRRGIIIIQTLFFVGISLFSGTIYLKYLASITTLSFLTMYGGLLLIGSWVLMSACVLTYCIKGRAR